MRLYAIRDRLIDYFMQPFVADSNPKVLAALAETINDTGNRHAISQTPHHFEVWCLAEINEETGNVTGKPEFLAECSSLVRGNIRETGNPAAEALPRPNGGGGGTPPATAPETGPGQRAPQSAP